MQPAENPSYALSSIFSSAPLPALPQSAMQVLELCQNPEVAPVDLAKPIESDAALLLQVMRFLNSSYFGFQREIRSVQQGLALVGVRSIKNFVLWTAVFSATPDPRCSVLAMQCFRRDALRRALFAKAIAEFLQAQQIDEVFTAALLQDIAVPFLARELSEYGELLSERQDGRVRLSELERARFGWTHADAACLMFERWNLPDEFGELVKEHVDVAPASDAPAAAAIRLSSMLPAETDLEWFEYEPFAEALRRIGIDTSDQCASLLNDLDQKFLDVAANMNVGAPKQSLVERYLEVLGESATSVLEAHETPNVSAG